MALRFRLDIDPIHVPQASYCLRLLLDGLGVPAREAAPDEDADLVYASLRPAGDAVWIRHQPVSEDWTRCMLTRAEIGDLPALVPPGGGGDFDFASGAVHGDLLSAAFSVLSGRAERVLPANEVGVPELLEGYFSSELLRRPIIAEYADRMGAVLQARWPEYDSREPRWPKGASWSVLLTHDVDMPYSQPSPRFYLRRAVAKAASREFLAAGRSVALAALRSASRTPIERDPRFGFSFWNQIGQRANLPRAVYVAATSSSKFGGDALDVGYDLEDRGLIKALQSSAASGVEIGLHASLWAREEWVRLKAERERLESKLGGIPIKGVRHHFWALDDYRPERTWRALSAAGFEYDSSLGMNRSIGFRRGMAWPFQPFDHHHRGPIDLLQLPPTCMDGAIAGLPASLRAEHLKSHLSAVRSHGGAVMLNWHLEQSDPSRLGGVGPLLAYVLQHLESESELYRATPLEMARWWGERSARLENRAHALPRLSRVTSAPTDRDAVAGDHTDRHASEIPATARRISAR